MTQRSFSFLLIIGTLFFWITWALVAIFVNPEESSFLGFFYFYFNLFFGVFGTVYFLSYAYHTKFFSFFTSIKRVEIATRQSFLISILLIGALWLQSQHLLNWFNIILFILILTLIEFFFISKKRKSEI